MAFANPLRLNNSDGRAGTEEMAGKHCWHVHKTVKATISFVQSVHLSIFCHGTIGPLTGQIFTNSDI